MKKRRNSDPQRSKIGERPVISVLDTVPLDDTHDTKLIKTPIKTPETAFPENASMMQEIGNFMSRNDEFLKELSSLKKQVIDQKRKEEQIKWLTEMNAKLMEKNQDQQQTIKNAVQSNIEMEAKAQNLVSESMESMRSMELIDNSLRKENEKLNQHNIQLIERMQESEQQKQAMEQRIKEMESESARKEISFKEQTETLQSHNNTMNERMNGMEREIKTKNDKISDLEQMNMTLREDHTFNTMMDEKIRETETRAKQLESDGQQLMRSMKEKQESFQRERDELLKGNKSMQYRIDRMSETIQQLEKERETALETAQRRDKRIEKLIECNTKFADLELQKTLLEDQIGQKERENKSLKQDLETQKDHITEWKTRIAKLESDKNALQDCHDVNQDMIESLKTVNIELKAKVVQLQQQHHKMDISITTHERDHEKLKKKNKSLQSKMEQLKAVRDSMVDSKAQWERITEKWKTSVQNLRRELGEVKQQKTSLEDHVHAMELSLKSLTKKNGTLKERVIHFVSLKESNESLQSKLENANQSIADLEKSNNNFQRQIGEITLERDNALRNTNCTGNTIANLQQSNAKLKTENALCKVQENEMKAERDMALQNIHRAQDTIEFLEKSVLKLKTEIAFYEEQMEHGRRPRSNYSSNSNQESEQSVDVDSENFSSDRIGSDNQSKNQSQNHSENQINQSMGSIFEVQESLQKQLAKRVHHAFVPESFKRKIQDLKHQIAILEGERKDLVEKKERSDVLNKSLTMSNETLKKRVLELEQEAKRLKLQVDELENLKRQLMMDKGKDRRTKLLASLLATNRSLKERLVGRSTNGNYVSTNQLDRDHRGATPTYRIPSRKMDRSQRVEVTPVSHSPPSRPWSLPRTATRTLSRRNHEPAADPSVKVPRQSKWVDNVPRSKLRRMEEVGDDIRIVSRNSP